MIQQTPQQRANTLVALNVMWPSVPSENVASGLLSWRIREGIRPRTEQPDCGTVACFGGWCAWWPTFRAQGVAVDFYGEPTLPSVAGYGTHVSEALFGTHCMFAIRGDHPADGDEENGTAFVGTDHQLVTNRLKWLLENSEVEEAA